MPSVHLLNVSPGDCSIIRQASGRTTMIDICDGNIKDDDPLTKAMKAAAYGFRPRGNFRMSESPTNPIRYAKSLGIENIYRFILTHPDMDHMDGLDALADEFRIYNFWDTGTRRDEPGFGDGSPYWREDWDRYIEMRDGNEEGVSSVLRQAGLRFAFANKKENNQAGGDGLFILAPNAQLALEASDGGDINDGSYVILYRCVGGRVLLPGDAHDNTWDYVLREYASDVENCSFMLAPHHGRDSDRSYDFLDHIKPKLTLIGSTPSEHIDYNQWSRRNLNFITSNQAGNVVLEIFKGQLDVYIENESFASAKGCDLAVRNSQGYVFLESIFETNE
jgi:competence protein ComEC